MMEELMTVYGMNAFRLVARPVFCLLLVGAVFAQTPWNAFGQPDDSKGMGYPQAVDGDPVSLSTGLYMVEEHDFVFPDWIPILLTRIYRSEDSASRAFGVGASHPFELYLLRNDLCTEMRLILPDGAYIQYLRTTGTNCLDATLFHKTTSTVFYNSSLSWNQDAQQWILRRQDGISYRFSDFLVLTEVEDAQKHRLTIGRDASQKVASVTSPCGYWVKFVRDNEGKIVRIDDFLGRRALYEYDGRRRLTRVEYPSPNRRISVYTYDAQDRMVSVGDQHGPFFWNTYDQNGRVITQRHPDGTSYEFRYVVTGTGKIRQTLVKNRQGKLRVSTFNDAGLTVADTWDAEGTRPRTSQYKWEAATNQLLSVTSSDIATGLLQEHNLNWASPTRSDQKSPEQLAADYRVSTHLAGQITDEGLRALTKPCEPSPMLKKMGPRKPMSREEIQQQWNEFVREERYQSIAFLNSKSQEVTESGINPSGGIVIEDRREGYLGGLFGLSRGGGWKIEGGLVAEVPIEGSLWQLYAKRLTQWSASLGQMANAVPKDSASWEFQLLSRNPMNRGEVRELKSFSLPALPTGVIPQGLLRYDANQHQVWIVIDGVLAKPHVEVVPIVPSFHLYRDTPPEEPKYQPTAPNTFEG
jgi:YD repeat-containing protein